MSRLQENSQTLHELLVGCFAHYGFMENALEIEIRFMLEVLCKEGKLERDVFEPLALLPAALFLACLPSPKFGN